MKKIICLMIKSKIQKNKFYQKKINIRIESKKINKNINN